MFVGAFDEETLTDWVGSVVGLRKGMRVSLRKLKSIPEFDDDVVDAAASASDDGTGTGNGD